MRACSKKEHLIAFLSTTLILLDIHTIPTRAVSGTDEPSTSKRLTGRKRSSAGESSGNISWTVEKMKNLLSIWDICEPNTPGFTNRLYKEWSKRFPQYANITKSHLKDMARDIIQESKIPITNEKEAAEHHARLDILNAKKRLRWTSQLRADFEKFWLKVPQDVRDHPERTYDYFVAEYPHHVDTALDREAMNKYAKRIRTFRKVPLLRGGRECVKDNYIVWNKNLEKQLMQIWDEVVSSGIDMGHITEIHNRWTALHPELPKITERYLMRKTNAVITEDTNRRIQNREKSEALRMRLRLLERKGKSLESIPGMNAELFEYYKWKPATSSQDVTKHFKNEQHLESGRNGFLHRYHQTEQGSYTTDQGASSKEALLLGRGYNLKYLHFPGEQKNGIFHGYNEDLGRTPRPIIFTQHYFNAFDTHGQKSSQIPMLNPFRQEPHTPRPGNSSRRIHIGSNSQSSGKNEPGNQTSHEHNELDLDLHLK